MLAGGVGLCQSCSLCRLRQPEKRQRASKVRYPNYPSQRQPETSEIGFQAAFGIGQGWKGMVSRRLIRLGEKQRAFAPHQPCHQNQQHGGLDDFAVGVGGEDFVAHVCREMEQHRQQDAAAAFQVQPVAQQHERHHAEHKIGGIKRPFGEHFAVVIALDKAQRQVPQRPIHGKQQRGGKQVQARQERVCAVAVPRQLFDGAAKVSTNHGESTAEENEGWTEM